MVERPTLRVMHTLPDFDMGGGQKLLLRLLQHMPDDGIEHIICSLGDGSMRPVFERAGIATHVIDHQGLKTLPSTVRALIDLMRREDVSLLHTNSRGDRIVGHLAAFIARTPVVTTYHSIIAQAGMTYPPFVRPLIRLVLRTMNNALARMGVKAKVVVSAAVRESRARDLYRPLSDFTVIHPGLSPEAYVDTPSDEAREACLQALGVAGAGPVLICVGRIVQQKGQHILVGMLPMLVGRWPGLCLLVVGDGADGGFLEEAIDRLGMASSVRLLGNRDDVPKLMAVSDMLVHASLSEGFGLVVLEAMAAGKPVVASNLPAIAEFVEDRVTGFLVDPVTSAAFADTVGDLLANPERRRSAGDAARAAARQYDIRGAAAALSEVYHEVLRDGRDQVARP